MQSRVDETNAGLQLNPKFVANCLISIVRKADSFFKLEAKAKANEHAMEITLYPTNVQTALAELMKSASNSRVIA